MQNKKRSRTECQLPHPPYRAPSPNPQVRLHKIFKLYNSDLEREMLCKMKNGLRRKVKETVFHFEIHKSLQPKIGV